MTGNATCFEERQEVQSVFTIPTQTLHTFWVLTGLCLSWGAVCLSARSVLRWMARSYAFAANDQSLKIAQYTAVVLLLPPTYGACALSALRVITTNREDTWTAESMMDVSELFSACALYAFQRLLVVYVNCLSPSLSLERSYDDGPLDMKNSTKPLICQSSLFFVPRSLSLLRSAKAPRIIVW